MGFVVEEIVDLVFLRESQSDYYEMLLHHVATVTLYGGMILNNNVN
jgi:hypothetical protein